MDMGTEVVVKVELFPITPRDYSGSVNVSREGIRHWSRRGPMSRVEFKKWSCRMSRSYSCPMSPLRCSHMHVACGI